MELTCRKRDQTGKQVKEIRAQKDIPAVVYGNEIESTSISVNLFDFEKAFKKAGETALIDLKVGKDTYKVLVKDVQYSPVTLKPLHASFFKPNLKEKTDVMVPVEVVGEEKNNLLKNGTAVLLVLMHEINVRALPTDLPDRFVVDVSALENIGDGVTVGQLEFDHEKVELFVEANELVVKLDTAQMEEEEEPAVTEAEAIAQMEATAETKPDEGEEVAETSNEKSEKK